MQKDFLVALAASMRAEEPDRDMQMDKKTAGCSASFLLIMNSFPRDCRIHVGAQTMINCQVLDPLDASR